MACADVTRVQSRQGALFCHLTMAVREFDMASSRRNQVSKRVGASAIAQP